MQIPLRHEGLYRALASPDFLPSREFGRPQLVPREIALMEAQKIRFGHLPEARALTRLLPCQPFHQLVRPFHFIRHLMTSITVKWPVSNEEFFVYQQSG